MRDGELWHGWDITYCQKDEFLVSSTNLERSDLAGFSNFTFFQHFSVVLMAVSGFQLVCCVFICLDILIVVFLPHLFSTLKMGMFKLVTDFDF